jgi:hypothetical protein
MLSEDKAENAARLEANFGLPNVGLNNTSTSKTRTKINNKNLQIKLPQLVQLDCQKRLPSKPMANRSQHQLQLLFKPRPSNDSGPPPQPKHNVLVQ